MGLSSLIWRHPLRAMASLAFRRIEIAGLEHLAQHTVNIVVADCGGTWTGPLVLATKVPDAVAGIVVGSDANERKAADILGWHFVETNASGQDDYQAIDALVSGIQPALPRVSNLVIGGGSPDDLRRAALLAISLATKLRDESVRLIPASIQRVPDGVCRESLLVQLAHPITVSPLRVGQRWQKQQRMVELNRLIHDVHASLAVGSSDWEGICAWDAVYRLYRREQASAWPAGTSERMFKVLQDEPDGQRLAQRVTQWLKALEAVGLRPEELDTSVEQLPPNPPTVLAECLLLPLVLIGVPLFAGLGWAGRLLTRQMFGPSDKRAFTGLAVAAALFGCLFLGFVFATLAVHGVVAGIAAVTLIVGSAWITPRVLGYRAHAYSVLKRLLALGRRNKTHAWAWQERASLLEATRLLYARPHGDEAALFPKSLLDR